MQYTFFEERDGKYGKTIVLKVAYSEIEKATEQEVDNFVDGIKVLLGAVLPSQTTGGKDILFNFAGCKTPQNLPQTTPKALS